MGEKRGSKADDPATIDARKEDAKAGSWSHFFGTVGKLLFRPTEAWKQINKTKAPLGSILWPHVVGLLLARGCAEFLGNLLQSQGLAVAFGQMASSALSWFVLIWIFAVAAASIAGSRGGELVVQDSFRFSAYALTPLFVIGILAVIPVPYLSRIADLLVMPYAFYVMAVGVVPMLRIPLEKAPGAIGLLTGTLVLLWAMIPTLLGEVLKFLQK